MSISNKLVKDKDKINYVLKLGISRFYTFCYSFIDIYDKISFDGRNIFLEALNSILANIKEIKVNIIHYLAEKFLIRLTINKKNIAKNKSEIDIRMGSK